MSIDLLNTPIEYLKGVGPQKADVFKKEFNILTYKDLLYYFPYRYVDRTKFYKINEISSELSYIQIIGRIIHKEVLGQGKGQRLVVRIADSSGVMELIWFNAIRYIKDGIKINADYVVFGKPAFFNDKWSMTHPEMTLLETYQSSQAYKGFYPLYNTSEKAKKKGLDSKHIAKLMMQLLINYKEVISETLPDEIIIKHKLPSRKQTLIAIHFPANTQSQKAAQERLVFEELLFLQLKMLKQKIEHQQYQKGLVFSVVGNLFNTFYHQYLPFSLTNAQKKVIKEIRKDLGSGRQMNRLLQGDVGSGKTITALLLILIALDNHFQACIMAPTEILALQHYETIASMLKTIPVRVALLTGSTKMAERKTLLVDLKEHKINILIGTHALIEDPVVFHNLGLVIIDEQHRFGVAQRAKLWQKNINPPHILVMTATPIPRTLAMTVYGDLDLSVIDELPKGRKPIKTLQFYDRDRLKVFNFMKQQIASGRQIYIVYPLIEESENLDLKYLMDGFESMSRDFPKPQYQISIVHGKQNSKDKDYEMQRFVKGETQIMIATTVIEVGIDVPNATVMVIENAERFGLSQLHQLRGRVGRGGSQSYCILMTKNQLSTTAQARIKVMLETTDGFKIANADLELRGPGDIQGTRQSGMLDFKIADLSRDEKMVAYTRQLALNILEEDPMLSLDKNSRLKKNVEIVKFHQLEWGKIS